MSCSGPIDDAVLADYWLGALAGPDEESVEEHLLECDLCGARLRDVIALADGVRRLAREGRLAMVVSDAFLRRAVADGLRVREYAPAPGGSVQCTVTEDDDLVVGRLAADVAEAGRVDLCICDKHGVEQARMENIPIDAGSASVVWQPATTFLKAAPSMTLVLKLLAFDHAGAERLLGEYTFHHTRSLPGPGAW
jgi:hypothetical protein